MTIVIAWLALACALLAVGTGAYRYGHCAARGGRSLPRWMTRLLPIAAAAAILLGVFDGGMWVGRGAAHGDPTAASTTGQADPPASQSGPVVPVQTVPIRRGTLEETISAYGRVLAQPGQTQVISLPFQAKVMRLLVTAGEQVGSGAALIRIAPSPDSQLQLHQAQTAFAAAQAQYRQISDEYRRRLAVNTQLLQARQTFRSAQLTLKRLTSEGVGKPTTLKASAAGVVSRIAVQEGQLVAAGTPLVEVANADRIEARLGVEPEDLPQVRTGAAVALQPVHATAAGAVTGHVRLVTREIDPATALVEVYVTLPPGAGLPLFSYVQGTMTARATQALIVPAEAVLPQKDGETVFTVDHGRAVRHIVRVGLETDKEVEVQGGGLEAGERVVTVGNYELAPGVAVSGQSAP